MKKLTVIIIAIASLLSFPLLSVEDASAATPTPTPVTNYSQYTFTQGPAFLSSPSSVMTWEQATITLPATEPTWAANQQETSAWLLADPNPSNPANDLGNWNQVGWVSYGPGSPPYLYEETNVDGVDVPQAFGPALQWGDTINVALSCDTSTGIWQDWGSHNATSGLTLLATEWTMVPCNTAQWFAAFERFSNGAATFPIVGAESITNLFADVMGDEYRPLDVSIPGLS